MSQPNLLITRRPWASSPSAAGGGSSEDEKGEKKKFRVRISATETFREGNEQSSQKILGQSPRIFCFLPLFIFFHSPEEYMFISLKLNIALLCIENLCIFVKNS